MPQPHVAVKTRDEPGYTHRRDEARVVEFAAPVQFQSISRGIGQAQQLRHPAGRTLCSGCSFNGDTSGSQLLTRGGEVRLAVEFPAA